MRRAAVTAGRITAGALAIALVVVLAYLMRAPVG